MDHRELFHNGTIEFKNNFRIKYYLNNVNKPVDVQLEEADLKVFDDTNIIAEQSKEKKTAILQTYLDKTTLSRTIFDTAYCGCNKYFEDLHKYMLEYQQSNKTTSFIEFIFAFGDTTSHKKIPCFVKAKTLRNNDYSVLLKLNTHRHIGMLPSIPQLDIPFYSKANKVIWRGSGTGLSNTQRFEFVKKYQYSRNPLIDVKFTSFPQKVPPGYSANEFRIAPHMSIAALLYYKFLISVEGNDVSTNLKWILLSNSVVLQPIPKKCSWFMEDMLIPFKHFVPLKDDFSDLEEKLKWCMRNLDKCEQITKNATEYMKIFLDEKNEEYVTTEVIKNYFQNVIFH